MCTDKSNPVSRNSFPPKEIFSPELLESYDPAIRATWPEREKVTGRPANDPSGVPKSKQTTFPQMREQPLDGNRFSQSSVKSTPREKVLSSLEQESEDKSEDSSSTRSSISKLSNSELQKEERSPDCNPGLYTPSMVSMITSSSP